MHPISDRITCLSHLLICGSFAVKNEQLSFELSPRFGLDNAGIGRLTYFPRAVPEISLDQSKDRLTLLEIDEMCLDHLNSLLTVIPRYDAESTRSSLNPQKKYVR